FLAFDAGFRGGVRVAAGDVNGDGVNDIIAGAGEGGSAHVKVFDGKTGQLIRSFFAFPGFGGGVFVAAGDVNGDGMADVIVGAGPAFGGGVFVAAGDVNGDKLADIIVGPGRGGPHHVRVFSGLNNQLLLSTLDDDLDEGDHDDAEEDHDADHVYFADDFPGKH